MNIGMDENHNLGGEKLFLFGNLWQAWQVSYQFINLPRKCISNIYDQTELLHPIVRLCATEKTSALT